MWYVPKGVVWAIGVLLGIFALLFLVAGCLNLFTGDVQEAKEAEESSTARKKASDARAEKARSEGRVPSGANTAPAPPPAPPPAPVPTPQKTTEAVTVRVTGTPGIAFQGSYGKLQGIRSVNGMTPQDLAPEQVEVGFLSFDGVTAVIQKQAGDNAELRVQILADGELREEQFTTAPYGVVSLNYTPGSK